MNKKGIFLMIMVGLLWLLAACQQSPQAAGSIPVEEVATLPASETVVPPESTQEAIAPVQAYTEEANLALVRRFYDEYSAGNADIILEIHPETILMHYAGSSDEVPAQLLRDDLAAIKEANPDLHAEIHSMYASGDMVVTELTWTGTHTGDLFDISATGKTLLHPGIVVRRLEDGLIVESWEMWDDLSLFNSLGYVPSWDELVAMQSEQAAEETADSSTPTSPIGVYRVQLSTNNPLGISSGHYRLSLLADGRYTIDWAPEEHLEGMMGVQGRYTVTENQITFTDEGGFAACTETEGISGRYSYAFLNGSLKLTKIEDGCEARAYVLTSKSLPVENVN
jgi:steroid delta-isomerase-like uncharacterized protein